MKETLKGVVGEHGCAPVRGRRCPPEAPHAGTLGGETLAGQDAAASKACGASSRSTAQTPAGSWPDLRASARAWLRHAFRARISSKPVFMMGRGASVWADADIWALLWVSRESAASRDEQSPCQMRRSMAAADRIRDSRAWSAMPRRMVRRSIGTAYAGMPWLGIVRPN